MQDDLLECAFKQYAKRSNCVAWCSYHKCYLTIIHLKNMKCLNKKCRYLLKQENHIFWIKRAKKKEEKKLKKTGAIK